MADQLIAAGSLDRVDERLVEMTNGCICCTLREDLLIEVARLAAENRFDHLLVESTGISEPLPVAAAFVFEDESGWSLSDVAELDTMVTVVDAVNFLADLEQGEDLVESGLGADEDDERAIADLLTDQVEFADVIVLSKCDLVDEERIGVVRSKGFAWLATRPDSTALWSQAGAVCRLDPMAPWWADTPKAEWPVEDDEPADLASIWQEPYGDRRQELVFIGIGMDEPDLVARLDGCLLRTAELAGGPAAWAALDDPFPEWDDSCELN